MGLRFRGPTLYKVVVMSNPLPPGVVPTLRQTKIKGKAVGGFYIMLQGEKINLETKDYFIARERAKECVDTGRKSFPPRDRNPLPALPPMTEPRKLSPGKSQSDGVPTDWASDLKAATDGAEPNPTVEENPSSDRIPDAPVSPDGYYSPEATLPPITPPTPENAPGDAPKPEFTELPPEMMNELLDTASMLLVQLQLDAQAFLIRKMVKREPGVLTNDNETRKGAVAIWKKYLSTSFPANIPLPPYLVAPLIIVSFGATEQIAKSTPLDTSAKAPNKPNFRSVP